MSDSTFLNGLIGKPVWIVCRDPVPASAAPLLLQEVSMLGIVADDEDSSHFFAWSEVMEVTPAEHAMESADAGVACFADSEP